MTVDEAAMPAPSGTHARERAVRWDQVTEVLAREGFIVIFLGWAIYLAFATETFLTESNVMILLRQAAIFAIIGIGTTMVAILGELDISFGAILSLAGCVGAAWIVGGHHPLIGFGLALGIGAAAGVINGVLVNYVRIPSVVATLGMLGMVEGLAAMYTGGESIFGEPLNQLSWIARGEVTGIPTSVLLAFGMYAVAWGAMTWTPFGAHLYATGDNREAAYRAGIPVQRIRLVVFVLAGALAGLAGLMQVARVGRAQATLGADALFPVLTAVILGGVSISGGRGRIVNTLIASVFLASITNGLILLGVDSQVQRVVQGAVLVLAVSLDRLRK